MTTRYLMSLCVPSVSACSSEPNFPPFVISEPPRRGRRDLSAR